MCKCIFCKKYSIKGLYRCEITGQIFKDECYGQTKTQLKNTKYKNDCPDFTAGIVDRIFAWIDEH